MAERLEAGLFVSGHLVRVRLDNDYNEPVALVRRRFIDWVGGGQKGLKQLSLPNGRDIWVRASSIDAVTFP